MTARKRILLAVAALAVAGSALGFIAFGDIQENLVYFWTPEELLAQGGKAHGATVRLGGVVKAGSVQWDPHALDLKFHAGMAAEPGGPAVHVQAHAAPPQMFREGMGVVVEGRYDGAVFHADRVMVKHSNEYRAPAEGEDPRSVYKSLVDESLLR